MLHRPEHTLRVRHHDRYPAIAGRHAGNTGLGTVRVIGITGGHRTPVVDITHGNQLVLGERLCAITRGELYPTFTMGHGNRHTGTGHAIQECRRRLGHFHHHQASFKLLRLVAHKARPAITARNQLMQVGEHLTAVTHTQCQGVLAIEEHSKLIPNAVIEQDGLCPAFTGTQNVTVGEPTTRHQALEVIQSDATGQQVTHVHVYRFETGTVKGRSHFNLAVYALLPQDRKSTRLNSSHVRISYAV